MSVRGNTARSLGIRDFWFHDVRNGVFAGTPTVVRTLTVLSAIGDQLLRTHQASSTCAKIGIRPSFARITVSETCQSDRLPVRQ